MSTADIFATVSTISYVVSIVCLILSVFLWFKFKIPSLYGDLSGKTARKSIEKMRENNEKSGIKFYKPSSVNVNRGKVTEAIENIQKDITTNKADVDSMETQSMDETKPLDNIVNKESSSEETTELNISMNDGTAMLNDDNETELLDQNDKNMNNSQPQLTVIEDVMIIHTDKKVL